MYSLNRETLHSEPPGSILLQGDYNNRNSKTRQGGLPSVKSIDSLGFTTSTPSKADLNMQMKSTIITPKASDARRLSYQTSIPTEFRRLSEIPLSTRSPTLDTSPSNDSPRKKVVTFPSTTDLAMPELLEAPIILKKHKKAQSGQIGKSGVDQKLTMKKSSKKSFKPKMPERQHSQPYLNNLFFDTHYTMGDTYQFDSYRVNPGPSILVDLPKKY